ncbi:alpha/beta hydrolase [Nocardioides sp.]|uniref:alpha/beta hydrolase n=1 Tax=Nocardioides sp. TaxID=35761 RepID=UPI003D11EB2F
MEPRLIPVREPKQPSAAVLVLHGGAARQEQMVVSPTQLSVLRMVATARQVARRGEGRLAVYRLLNSFRGWDPSHTPVRDVRWALAQVQQRVGDLDVGLVGHSLGGRAALLSGDQPRVTSVVALNAWVAPGDDVDLTARGTLFVHGLADRVASPARAQELARRLAATARVSFIAIPDGKHAMLRHGRAFDRYAADYTCHTLLGGSPNRQVSGPVGRVLAGEDWVTA